VRRRNTGVPRRGSTQWLWTNSLVKTSFGRHHLQLGLHRYLIDFDPLAYVLGRRKSCFQPLSQPAVQLAIGSFHWSCSHTVGINWFSISTARGTPHGSPAHCAPGYGKRAFIETDAPGHLTANPGASRWAPRASHALARPELMVSIQICLPPKQRAWRPESERTCASVNRTVRWSPTPNARPSPPQLETF